MNTRVGRPRTALAQDAAARLSEQVREACIDAALRAYESASMSGLCGEGALEAAVSAMRMLDLSAVGRSDPGTGPEALNQP